MELIAKKRTYVDKSGDEKVGFNYFVLLDNGNYIQVKPVFKDDYTKIKICSRVVND